MVVQDTLRALVAQARAAGHTWAEIGDLLRVSRQAAFQRFAGVPHPSVEEGDGILAPVEGVVEHAVSVLHALLDGRFDDARAVRADAQRLFGGAARQGPREGPPRSRAHRR
jgi:hypothetical protein